jgi:hypothetical protein
MLPWRLLPLTPVLQSLCNTHCMGGCDVCGPTSEWKTCSEPLMVLARMCYGELVVLHSCNTWTGCHAAPTARCTGLVCCFLSLVSAPPVLSRYVAEMPTMPECDATGFNGMCMDPEVKENFPLVCGEPPVVPDTCA